MLRVCKIGDADIKNAKGAQMLLLMMGLVWIQKAADQGHEGAIKFLNDIKTLNNR
jgi:hypothetical protein